MTLPHGSPLVDSYPPSLPFSDSLGRRQSRQWQTQQCIVRRLTKLGMGKRRRHVLRIRRHGCGSNEEGKWDNWRYGHHEMEELQSAESVVLRIWIIGMDLHGGPSLYRRHHAWPDRPGELESVDTDNRFRGRRRRRMHPIIIVSRLR